jgi:hypothetical protein
MKVEEAAALLNACTRIELRDHAFGDTEVVWRKDGVDIAAGYFSGVSSDVTFYGKDGDFTGPNARELRKCGNLIVGRNDETGPDEYQEGVVMPGLTLEGVRQELAGE